MSLEDRLYPLLALYQRLPDPVRLGVGRVYRSLPESIRLGAAYREFRALADAASSWSAAETREYQWTELRRTLVHAVTNCPHYTATFAAAGFDPRSLEHPSDLARCPLLTKSDVQQHRDALASSAVPSSRRLYVTTGGSTGVPVGFYLEKGVSRAKEQAFLEAMWHRVGYRPGARLAVIRGGVVDERADGRISTLDATRNWLILSSYHLTDERLPDYLAAIERFAPDFLHVYPSAALQIAEFLERAGQHWRTPVRALLCGSERLSRRQKRMLERVFGCPVYRWYGHSERVVLAGEGEESELYYFWPQYGWAEFGPPDQDGLCEVIGTSFHNMAMPLVRYRTGDLVRPDDAEHLRELPWATAVEIVGREQEFLVSAAGRRISLTAINMHDAVFDDLYAVQFVQDEPGVAELRYVPAPSFDRSREAIIEEELGRKLGDDFRLVLRAVSETEKTARGKHRWLVSRLDDRDAAERSNSPG